MQEDDGCACQNRTDWLNLYNAIRMMQYLGLTNCLFLESFISFFFGLISNMVTEQMEREFASKERLLI